MLAQVSKGLRESAQSIEQAQLRIEGCRRILARWIRLRIAPAVSAIDRKSMVKRVLVVDNHRDGADMLGELLRTYGCIVQIVYSGETAVRAAEDFQPDLIVLDLKMQGIDGLETARRIKQQGWAARTTLVAQTAELDPQMEHLSKALGFLHHVTKPPRTGAFAAILRSLPPRTDAQEAASDGT